MTEDIDLPHLPECLLSLPLETLHEIQSHTYHAIKADRQQRGEPVAWVKQDIAENQFINMRPRRIWWECNEGIGMPIFASPQPAKPAEPRSEFEDSRVQQVYEIICGDNHPPAGEHWDGYVSRLIVDALFPSESVKSPSDDEIREVFLANSFTIKPGHDDLKQYVYDAARALLARYGHPVVPEGWRLIPKELIDFLDAKEHHLPGEDRHVLSIMLEAAPKFGEEE